MATHNAVPAVGRAIVSLLEQASRESEFSDVEFALLRSEDFEQPIQGGVSIYLYRVEAVHASGNSPPPARGGGRRLPTLPLSLHYMLTAWGADAASEHGLLAWAMRVLDKTPVLPSAFLNQASAGAFSESEIVELSLENVGTAEVLDLWQALGRRYRLSVCYQARRIVIDSPATPS